MSELIAAESGHTYPTSAAIYVFTCFACGLLFGIDDAYDDRRRKDGRSFYCPNGHSLSYNETEEDNE